MDKVTRNKDIGAPVSAMYAVITDFEAYPEFLPEVVKAEILESSDVQARVRFEIEVIKRFEYILHFHMNPESEVRWELDESNFFKTNQGVWRLSAKDDKQTHVDYEVEVGFGFLVPKWIVKKLTSKSLPKMFDNFERRAAETA